MNSIKKTINAVSKFLGVDSVFYFNNNENSFSAGQLSLSEVSTDSMAQNAYKKSLYLTSGLRLIKDVFSNVEFKLYEITSSKGELKEIATHDIIDLLYKPNPLQTKLEFWRILIESFIFSKEVFIRIILDGSKPKHLIILNPRQVEVKYDDSIGKLYYVLSKENGERVTIPDEEMVHIKDADLSNQLRGTSDLSPIISRVMVESEASNYQRGMFATKGNLDTVLTVKDASQDEAQELRAKLFNSFNGKNDKMGIAVIGGEAELKQVNKANSILDYKSAQELTRDDINNALGIPKALVTSDNVNRANADAAFQQFLQFTIAPMVRLVVEALNERFVIKHYGEKYYLEPEKLVTEDKEMLLKELEVTVNGRNQIISVNEARQRLGYESVEGSDVLNVNQTITLPPQEAKRLFKTRRNHYEQLRIKEIQLQIAKKKVSDNLNADPIFQAKYKSAIESQRESAQNKLEKEVKKVFESQYERMLTNINNVPEGKNIESADAIFDKKAEAELTKQALLPVIALLTQKAGHVALTPVRMLTQKGDNYGLTNQAYAKMEDRVELFSAGINETTYKAIAEVVAQEYENGVEGIKRGLKDTFYESYIGRIATIAQTESGYLTSLGTQLAFQDSPVVSGKKWLSTRDAKVRVEHQINDGKIVDKSGVFPNGEAFPAQHSVNCRCTLAPVVDINAL